MYSVLLLMNTRKRLRIDDARHTICTFLIRSALSHRLHFMNFGIQFRFGIRRLGQIPGIHLDSCNAYAASRQHVEFRIMFESLLLTAGRPFCSLLVCLKEIEKSTKAPFRRFVSVLFRDDIETAFACMNHSFPVVYHLVCLVSFGLVWKCKFRNNTTGCKV